MILARSKCRFLFALCWAGVRGVSIAEPHREKKTKGRMEMYLFTCKLRLNMRKLHLQLGHLLFAPLLDFKGGSMIVTHVLEGPATRTRDLDNP
jgi:hypothetical protein